MMLVFSWPGTPVYDGVRLFLMVFPVWAIAAGLGFQSADRIGVVAVTLTPASGGRWPRCFSLRKAPESFSSILTRRVTTICSRVAFGEPRSWDSRSPTGEMRFAAMLSRDWRRPPLPSRFYSLLSWRNFRPLRSARPGRRLSSKTCRWSAGIRPIRRWRVTAMRSSISASRRLPSMSGSLDRPT